MFRVLGAVEAEDPDGVPVPLGDRQRALLASLLARAGTVVSVDELTELVWPDRQPADPAAALQNQVSRLRRALPWAALRTRSPGYLLEAGDDLDANRFTALLAAAAGVEAARAADLVASALSLWRGRAYAGFADGPVARFEAIRLDEARLHAVEDLHRHLLDAGRAEESLPALEAFVGEHPLRERARETLMRVLYATGRHADALRTYAEYERRLGDELGLTPAAGIARLQVEILRHDLEAPAPPPLAALRARYVTVPAGPRIAVATLGAGPPLVALPGWVSSIEVIASGRDPRSSLLQELVGHCAVTLYDRHGTGLSRGPVTDFGFDATVDELEAVVRHLGTPVSLLAMSQAGPVAVALAARRPDLVHRLVFLGTYADGTAVFTRPELNAALVAMVRSHWGLGSTLFAGLYRPEATEEAAHHLGMVLRDSADRDVAAGYLEAVYDVDVTDLLPSVAAPSLVVHYRGDRLVPFEGGRHLASSLPDAVLVPLEGRFHLPDARDLHRVVAEIASFLHS
jgi:DNA-binding SARP family transcriptional activator/pimeloyl-ACP methyl ester carboxylesterase